MATISVFRQHIEALVEFGSTIQVYRQHVEALVSTVIPNLTPTATSTLVLTQDNAAGKFLNKYAENTLTLTDEAVYIGPKELSAASYIALSQLPYVGQEFEVSAASTVTLTVSLEHFGTQRISAESILVLQQFGDNIIKVRSEESAIVLTQAATVEKVLVGSSQLVLTQTALVGSVAISAENTLNLQHTIRLDPLPQTATTQIEFDDAARSSLKSLTTADTLSLSQDTVVIKPIRVSAESLLSWSELVYNEEIYDYEIVWYGLSQSAVVNPSVGVDNTTYLSFSQMASPGHVKASGTSVSATSTLTLTHSAIVNVTGDGVSTLTLTQAATGQLGIPVVSQLALTQSAAMLIDRSLSAITTLSLSQAAAYTLVIASTKSQYSPFIGSSTDSNAPDPPSTTIDGPMAGIQVPFQLVYPSVGAVTDAVSLSTPNLGNLDRLSFNRIQRETRGGTLIVFADPDWPRIQTLVLSFSGLLNVEAQALLTFMDDYLGREIGLIDWEHRYWRGIIVTPDEPIVEDRFDSFTASFSFEGELDPDWNPQVVPPTLRYSATRTPQEDGYYVPNEPILPSVDVPYYLAEADSPTQIGSPLYLTGVGHVDLAQANAAGTVQVAGLALAAVAAGFSCDYISEGSIERTNWSVIAGTTNLSPGATYFLDPSGAGRITTTAPTTAGQYVVRVGRAVSTTALDIEIELPILL